MYITLNYLIPVPLAYTHSLWYLTVLWNGCEIDPRLDYGTVHTMKKGFFIESTNTIPQNCDTERIMSILELYIW